MSNQVLDFAENYADTLPGQLATMTNAVAVAAIALEEAALQRTLELLGREDVQAASKFLHNGDAREAAAILPAFAMAVQGPTVMKSAVIEQSFDISTSEQSSLTKKTNVESTTSGTVGGWFFKGSQSVKASHGVDKERKRQSDFRSSMNVRIELGRIDPPEGVSRVLEFILGGANTNSEAASEPAPARAPAKKP